MANGVISINNVICQYRKPMKALVMLSKYLNVANGCRNGYRNGNIDGWHEESQC
jgi:hypothetical protein